MAATTMQNFSPVPASIEDYYPSKRLKTSQSQSLGTPLPENPNTFLPKTPNTPRVLQLDPSNIPEGWTNDPEELDYEDEWAANDTTGQQLVHQRKLGDRAYPIMVHPLGFSVMFMAGGKFYVFNRLSWSLEQICSPTSLDDIMSVIKDKGMWGLEWKTIQ